MEEQKNDGQDTANNSEGSGANAETPSVPTHTMTPEAAPMMHEPGNDKQVQPAKKGSLGLIIGVAIALLLLAGLYFMLGPGAAPSTNIVSDEAAASYSAIVDEDIVARVNGTEVTGEELKYQLIQVAQLAGIPDINSVEPQMFLVMKSQALDAIVNTEILNQAAAAEGIGVTPEEVDAEFATILENIGGQEVANERLSALGITEEDFKENLVSDILIKKYLDAHASDVDLEVTDEEIQAFYDQVTGGATEGVPPIEEVTFQIQEQLQFQKEQEALASMIEELRTGSNVEILE